MPIIKSDQDLIKSYLSGNETAFEILIAKHKDKVFAFILSKIKNYNLAHDVFQDTFIKVINSLKRGKYNEEGKFVPWVMRIAHNLVIDHFRNSSKMPIVGRKHNTDNDDFDIFKILRLEECTIEDELVLEQIFQDVRDLVEKLPNEQKEVVKMRHYMGMSFKDIAESTGVSINTALGRMRYALINLRKLINDHEIMLTAY